MLDLEVEGGEARDGILHGLADGVGPWQGRGQRVRLGDEVIRYEPGDTIGIVGVPGLDALADNIASVCHVVPPDSWRGCGQNVRDSARGLLCPDAPGVDGG